MTDFDSGTQSDATVLNDVRSVLTSYQVLFERAALTAQLADDEACTECSTLCAVRGRVRCERRHHSMNTAMRDRLGCLLDKILGRGLLDDCDKRDGLRNSIRSAINTGYLAPEWITKFPERRDSDDRAMDEHVHPRHGTAEFVH